MTDKDIACRAYNKLRSCGLQVTLFEGDEFPQEHKRLLRVAMKNLSAQKVLLDASSVKRISDDAECGVGDYRNEDGGDRSCKIVLWLTYATKVECTVYCHIGIYAGVSGQATSTLRELAEPLFTQPSPPHRVAPPVLTGMEEDVAPKKSGGTQAPAGSRTQKTHVRPKTTPKSPPKRSLKLEEDISLKLEEDIRKYERFEMAVMKGTLPEEELPRIRQILADLREELDAVNQQGLGSEEPGNILASQD